MSEQDNSTKPIYYTGQQALEKAAAAGITTTLATLLTWVDKHKLGFQPSGNGGHWYIFRNKFDAFITGQAGVSNGKD